MLKTNFNYMILCSRSSWFPLSVDSHGHQNNLFPKRSTEEERFTVCWKLGNMLFFLMYWGFTIHYLSLVSGSFFSYMYIFSCWPAVCLIWIYCSEYTHQQGGLVCYSYFSLFWFHCCVMLFINVLCYIIWLVNDTAWRLSK